MVSVTCPTWAEIQDLNSGLSDSKAPLCPTGGIRLAGGTESGAICQGDERGHQQGIDSHLSQYRDHDRAWRPVLTCGSKYPLKFPLNCRTWCKKKLHWGQENEEVRRVFSTPSHPHSIASFIPSKGPDTQHQYSHCKVNECHCCWLCMDYQIVFKSKCLSSRKTGTLVERQEIPPYYKGWMDSYWIMHTYLILISHM